MDTTNADQISPSATHSDPELAQPSNSLSPTVTDDDHDLNVKLSGQRWLVLLAVCVFGLLMTLAIETTPILHTILELLDLRIDKYLYITQTFYYVMALFSVPTAWFVDKYGIKLAIRVAAVLFLIQGTFRALVYYPDLPYWSQFKLFYYITTRLVGVQVFAIFLLLPLKVSESWFSASERSVAWTLMFSQLNIGSCIASFIYPKILKTLEDIKILAYLNIVCVLVTTLTSFICVTKSQPDHPPSKRMAEATKDKSSFLVSIKKMLKHRDILIHLIHNSIFESAILSESNVIQDIFTSTGHAEEFAGNVISANALISLVMQIILSSFIHKVKNITMSCKLSAFSQALIFVIYLGILAVPSPSWIVIGVSIILTICRSWTLPTFTNMSAYLACGTVSQATIIAASMTLTVLVMTVIQMTFISMIKISKKHTDYLEGLLFLGVATIINATGYLIFFTGRSAKVDEDENRVESSLESSASTPS